MGAPTALDRYHRQMLLPGFGLEGQTRLASARVLVAGCGALGAGVLDALARAGVGTLVMVDRDVLELTNLQRQTLYDQAQVDAGMPKAEAAAARLALVNPEVRTVPEVADLTAATAPRLAADVDLIVDGLDNFETRYLLNDLAVRRGVPYVYGGAVGLTGMSMPILPHPRHRSTTEGAPGAVAWPADRSTPCLRCLFPEPPPPGSTPTCDTVGVLGPVVALVAALQATHALKILTGQLDALDRRLANLDLGDNAFRFLEIGDPDPSCPCCGRGEFPFLAGRAEGATTVLCGRDAVQVTPARDASSVRFDLAEAAARLATAGRFERTRFMVRGAFATERTEDGGSVTLSLFADGRAILHGVRETERARTIYARYIGA